MSEQVKTIGVTKMAKRIQAISGIHIRATRR